MSEDTETSSGSNTPKLIICWLVVLIPAAWGVCQTVIKSMSLFTKPT